MVDTVHKEYNGVFEAIVGVDSSSSMCLLLTSVQYLLQIYADHCKTVTSWFQFCCF